MRRRKKIALQNRFIVLMITAAMLFTAAPIYAADEWLDQGTPEKRESSIAVEGQELSDTVTEKDSAEQNPKNSDNVAGNESVSENLPSEAANSTIEEEPLTQQKESKESETAVAPEAPLVTNWTRTGKSSMKLYWVKVGNADGYEIQYARKSRKNKDWKIDTKGNFVSSKGVMLSPVDIADSSQTSYVIGNLTANETYSVQIRAYVKVTTANELSEDGAEAQKVYSSWSMPKISATDQFAKISVLKPNGKTTDLVRAIGATVNGYSTLQGSCTDGTYSYHIMENKTNEKCKIVKIRISDMKIVKTSAALNLGHGNDMTYNPDTGRIVVVHYTKHPKRFSMVNPNTLKIVAYKDVSVSKSIRGNNAVDGYTAIAYSSARKQYVARVMKNRNLVIMDQNMNPVKLIKPTKRCSNDTSQGMDATDDYILDLFSPLKSSYNVAMVYDWDGNFLFKKNLSKSYESESIYHIGDTFYMGFYHSHYVTKYKKQYKTKYVTRKVKWKKVNGKWKYKKKKKKVYVTKTVTYKVKWKKVNGKWKYKKKKKKVRVTEKVPYKSFTRSAYLYKVGEIKPQYLK